MEFVLTGKKADIVKRRIALIKNLSIEQDAILSAYIEESGYPASPHWGFNPDTMTLRLPDEHVPAADPTPTT